MNWQERISVDPAVCHGKVCVKGTRVMVTTILDSLAEGLSTDDVLRSFPTLHREDVQAAIYYASDLAAGRVVTLPEAG